MEKPTNIRAVCKDCSEERHKQWQQENSDKKIKEGDFVKIAVTDNKKVEHMWFRITQIVTDKDFFGELDNEPVLVNNIQYKDEITIKFKDIEGFIKK